MWKTCFLDCDVKRGSERISAAVKATSMAHGRIVFENKGDQDSDFDRNSTDESHDTKQHVVNTYCWLFMIPAAKELQKCCFCRDENSQLAVQVLEFGVAPPAMTL